MPCIDTALNDLFERLDARLNAAGLTRSRGGFVRGTHWAERSGPSPDRLGWFELRLHHRKDEREVKAALLEYQSLARGGRTVVCGEATVAYTDDEGPSLVTARLETLIREWLPTYETAQAGPLMRELPR